MPSPDSGRRTPDSPGRFSYALLIAAAAGILAAGIFRAKPLQSANDRSRWSTVYSLVERGTYRIDDIQQHRDWQTIDKVRHEGHFYSTKPPLFPTLVAGLCLGIRAATGWSLLDHTTDTSRIVLFVVNLLPMVVALALLAAIVERYARTSAAKLYVMAVACFGTLLTPFSLTLNNHTVAAWSVVFAIFPAMRIVLDGERGRRLFACAGFFAAFACTNELPAALFGVLLFALLAWRAPRATCTWFVPAALVPLGAFFLTNYLATGGWKPFYLYYGTEKYLYVHQGRPSYWMQPKGLDANRESPLVYLLNCTVGHHGILSLSPVYLLSLAGMSRAWRKDSSAPPPSVPRLTPFLWLGFGLTVAILIFYLTRTQNYNYGGNSAGLRWMLWLTPFWLVALIPALDRWQTSSGFRLLAALLLFASVFSAFEPIPNPWQHPWLFDLMTDWGWIDYGTG